MKDTFKKLIYEWVVDNFGESEADDPSWNIDELAKYLTENFSTLYWQQELEHIKEDVERYADSNIANVRLTEQQAYNVAEKIRNSDWYCSINGEDIEYYVARELNNGK